MNVANTISTVWIKAVNLGTEPDMPFIKMRSIRSLNIISFLCAPFPLILSIILSLHIPNVSYLIIVGGALSTLSISLVPYFNKLRKYHTGRLIMNLSVCTSLVIDAFLIGGGYGLELPFFVVLIGAFSFNEFNWEIKFYSALAFIGIMLCILAYSTQGTIPHERSTPIQAMFATSSFLFSIVCLTVLKAQSERYEKKIQHNNQELQIQKETLQVHHDNLTKLHASIREKNEKLGKKNYKITESLNYARRIQQSTLPNAQKLDHLLKEYFIFYQPKDIVSGDFYWVFEQGEHTYFAVADCTGHGVPGAFMSLLGINTLQQIVQSLPSSSPSEILTELDYRISEQLNPTLQDDTFSSEGMDITLCQLTKKTNTLRFASANRPLFLVRNCILNEYKGTRTFTGSHSFSERTFTDTVIQLQKQDTLYLFTDGYTDQFDIEDKKKFGIIRFKNFLPEIVQVPMEAQLELIKHEYERWKGHVPQTDDILILGYRYQ